MLILSRHQNEAIVIGDDVVVTIKDIRGNTVRIGIEAPKETPVFRREVWDLIQQENEREREQ